MKSAIESFEQPLSSSHRLKPEQFRQMLEQQEVKEDVSSVVSLTLSLSLSSSIN